MLHTAVRKSHRTIIVTRHQEDICKAANILPNQDECKTRKDTKHCTTKHETNKEPPKWEQQSTTKPPPENGQQHICHWVVLMYFTGTTYSPLIVLLLKHRNR